MFAVTASTMGSRVAVKMPRAAVKKQQPRRCASIVRAGNVVDTCKANGCSKFAELAERVGLSDVLNAGTFTIFAPTDEAFGKFNPEGLSLPDVLNFHCVKGKIAEKHITNYPLIMTLEGTKIAIDSKTFKAEGRIEVGSPPQGTQGLAGRVDGGFVIRSVEADNGVVHVLDGVATPKKALIGQNGGYVAGTEPGSGEGRTGLDVKSVNSGQY